MAILQQGIRRVSASEGGVTARLRRLWGCVGPWIFGGLRAERGGNVISKCGGIER